MMSGRLRHEYRFVHHVVGDGIAYEQGARRSVHPVRSM